MSQYYLRLEAVNLSNVVYDTKDLSTIRGGGLLLLKAVDWISQEITSVRLNPLMTGASAGLYKFEAEDSQKAEEVRRLVMSYLVSHFQSRLKHATFVADVQPAHEVSRFNSDHEMLIAKNRWRQMQSPTIAMPCQNDNAAITACDIDGVRPGTRVSKGPEKKTVSESVYVRQEYGRKQKQAFYKEQSGGLVTAQFTHNLDELTNDPEQGNLHHKMAVIYLDGNRFGKVKKANGADLNRQTEFDKTLKEYRRKMLTNLLHRIAQEEHWKTPGDDRFRLETLLWGGDEVIWVVPAWKAWEVLSFFFEQSKSWSFMKEERLHHAGGMVLCHHNAPIHRITALARDLAELAKDKDRRRSLFAYEVLESFDHIGRDLRDYRKERCPQPLNPNDKPDPHALILAGDDMHDVLEAAGILKEKLPRRKLHAMIEDLLAKAQLTDEDEITARGNKREALVRELCDGLNDQASSGALATLTSKLGGDEARWLHLSALWDYLA